MQSVIMFYKNKQRGEWLMGLTFRKINADDFPLCADILVSAYKSAPWYNSWTKEEAQLRIEAV